MYSPPLEGESRPAKRGRQGVAHTDFLCKAFSSVACCGAGMRRFDTAGISGGM
jgi:hypothetical protein